MAKSKIQEVAKATKKIKFTHSPIGAYGLSHFVGDEVELPCELAQEIIDNGHAEEVTE